MSFAGRKKLVFSHLFLLLPYFLEIMAGHKNQVIDFFERRIVESGVKIFFSKVDPRNSNVDSYTYQAHCCVLYHVMGN